LVGLVVGRKRFVVGANPKYSERIELGTAVDPVRTAVVAIGVGPDEGAEDGQDRPYSVHRMY